MIPGLEILNLHAQGGMAEVYRARGLGADGRMWPYAVKRILPEFTRDEMLRGMFVEEARIASLLLHPNIVRVYDLVRADNDDYYIVMEFLEVRLAATLRGATHEKVGQKLRELGLDEDLSRAIVAELQNAEFARFTPPDVRREVLEATVLRLKGLVTRADQAAERAAT